MTEGATATLSASRWPFASCAAVPAAVISLASTLGVREEPLATARLIDST